MKIQWFYRRVDDSNKYQLLQSYIADVELKFRGVRSNLGDGW